MLDSTHFRELQAIGLEALTIHNGQNYCLTPSMNDQPQRLKEESDARRIAAPPLAAAESE